MTNPLRLLGLAVSFGLALAGPATHAEQPNPPAPGQRLTNEQVATFARLALDGIEREYPNKPSNVMVDAESVQSPRAMHPVFYGCFDWHSSVHGHWMLVRLAKEYPDAPCVAEIRTALARQLTAEKLATEADYFLQPQNQSFERMYGWAWTLRLALELRTWDDPDAPAWAENLAPLEQVIVRRTREYLPRLTYPVRTGVHPDTAFALGQALDYARGVGDGTFQSELLQYCRAKYHDDEAYSARFEPSGEDFFSPSLNEADLMRRVLERDEFAEWLGRFLPAIETPGSNNSPLLQPATVSDPSDPKIVHLAGLNLSRAWTQNGILSALPGDDPRRPALAESVEAHTAAGLEHVFSGHYEGEHWLATFAVYLLTEVGLQR